MTNYKSDEEYHFSESETPVSYTVGAGQSKKDKDFQSRRKGRNILLLLAILTAVWAIYKFIGIFLSQANSIPHKSTAPTHVQTPVVNSQPQPTQLISPPKPTQPAQPMLSATQVQEIVEQKTRLNKMEAEIVNLQTTLAEINTRLSDLSSQVSNLANKPPPIVEVKKPVIPRKRWPIKKHTPYIAYSYQLKATIPGRAWIMRSDGTNLTVSLGDRISGYGTVIGIDPNEGVVQTSSGATIKYSSR